MLAFVLAAFAAFAFNMPKEEMGLYIEDPDQPGVWLDLTNVTPGDDTYRCVSTGDCLRSEPSPTAPFVTEGTFQKNSETLPIVED